MATAHVTAGPLSRKAVVLATCFGIALVGALAISQLAPSRFVASYALVALSVALAPLAVGLRSRRGAGGLWLAISSLLALAALDAEVSILFWPVITLQGASGSFIVADPLLGYGPRPGAHATITWRRLGRVIYAAHYTIGSDGFRSTRGASGQAAATTVFVGDSYTFGDGLNDSQTLPQQYADATDHRQKVINAAFSGYGTNQVLALIDSGRLTSHFGGGPRLVIYPAIDEHLGRIDGRSPLHRVGTPHYALINGAARFLGPFHPGLEGQILDIASRSAIVSSLRDLALAAPRADAAPLFGAMVERARDDAERLYGASFIVVLWDEPVWQDGDNRRRSSQRAAAVTAMADQMARRGVAFVRVSALLPDYKAHMSEYVMAGSGHPSALLNRRLARALAARLTRTPPSGARGSEASIR